MTVPTVLTLAGSDSSAGAGIQADLKTCQELDVYAMTAITAITAQNTLGVKGITPVAPSFVYEQAAAVLDDIGTNVIKTGMLVDEEHVHVVCKLIDRYAIEHVVVDPVIASTSGSALLSDKGIQALKTNLLPKTTVFTPNIPEALTLLVCKEPENISDLKQIAIQLYQLGPKAIVLKGGHYNGSAVDVFYDRDGFMILEEERLHVSHTHGTGCTFAAAVAAEIAKGQTYRQAVTTAKTFITEAIRLGIPIGSGKGPTNHTAYRKMMNERE